ncbi:hypothetical protein HMPREF9005_2499, partial [Actinomyces sp. oral taxon 178 str. F0338]
MPLFYRRQVYCPDIRLKLFEAEARGGAAFRAGPGPAECAKSAEGATFLVKAR